MLGPGLITGASDDDPSGIATYMSAGAAFGYQTLWTAPLTFPLMFSSAVHLMVTGTGLAFQILGSYRLLTRILKWLALALLAYIGAAILARPDWGAVLKASLANPQRQYLMTLVAILGTTISPCLFLGADPSDLTMAFWALPTTRKSWVASTPTDPSSTCVPDWPRWPCGPRRLRSSSAGKDD